MPTAVHLLICGVLVLISAQTLWSQGPNVTIQSSSSVPVYLRDKEIPVEQVATIHEQGTLFLLPSPFQQVNVSRVDGYKLLGYAPIQLSLDPGSHRLYAVSGTRVLDFTVIVGATGQTWTIRPQNDVLTTTGGLLGVYGLIAIPCSTGSTYVDAAHGKWFGTGARFLTSGIVALALGVATIVWGLPSVTKSP